MRVGWRRRNDIALAMAAPAVRAQALAARDTDGYSRRRHRRRRIVLPPYVPDAWTVKIGAQAIDGILNVLASSMLAVTVFSLSTMVAAYGAATTNVTPRATRLLMEDNTSQNVLGTFIGSFLFSLVGIIALSTGAYGDQGRAILLVVTIGLIVVIAATILQWIDYLARFGRLSETIERVEEATWKAMETRLAHPYLGGRPFGHGEAGVPVTALPVFAEPIGYVQNIDVAALQECAKTRDAQVFVKALPGAFADPSRPVAMVVGDETGEMGEAVAKAFTVGAERTFDQDPRFGLCVLAEIASRALSPAVNDPGTAIDVIGVPCGFSSNGVVTKARLPTRGWPFRMCGCHRLVRATCSTTCSRQLRETVPVCWKFSSGFRNRSGRWSSRAMTSSKPPRVAIRLWRWCGPKLTCGWTMKRTACAPLQRWHDFITASL
jgi:Predicted membrane protein (DUF2254)